MTHHDDILFQQINGLGLITLNRPKALNAINFHMVKSLTQKLIEWADDSSIKVVAIKGAGEKAFCAGGDVRAMYQAKQNGHLDILSQFYKDEYSLNYLISTYPKPYLALMNGITMGGGVGVSIHGKFRLATERLVFAMPETTIGFFPDVGGSYFLSRCPDAMGLYLGLTGDKIGPEACFELGLVTHYTNSVNIPKLEKTLQEQDWGDDPSSELTEILTKFHQDPGKSDLKAKEKIIESCFGQKDVTEIISALKQSKDPWAQDIADNLLKKSPIALKVTHKQILLGKNYDLKQGLEMEYRISQHFMRENEFFEGVRALLIDKDQKPAWNPITLNSISPEKVDAYFVKLDGSDFLLEERF